MTVVTTMVLVVMILIEIVTESIDGEMMRLLSHYDDSDSDDGDNNGI